MNTWPAWHLEEEPAALAKYVLPAEVARYLKLPGPSDQSTISLVRQVYEAIVQAQIVYAFEPPDVKEGWQAIRPPSAVLGLPGHGTCLDVVLIAAGALLVSGVKSIPVIVDSIVGNRRHALILLDLDQLIDRPHGSGVMRAAPHELGEDLLSSVDNYPGRYCAIDVVTATLQHGVASGSFEEAVDRGRSFLTGSEWAWKVGVDLGILWEQDNVLRLHEERGNTHQRPAEGRWFFRGGQGRAHFLRSARGQRVLDTETDAFVGRAHALSKVRDHVRSTEHEKPLVITGKLGSGKSCVLARAVEQLADDDVDGLAFHCAESTTRDFLSALGETLNCTPELGPIQEALASPNRRILVLAVDALDECRTEDDREGIVRAIRELSRHRRVRVIVATRDNGEDQSNNAGVLARLHDGRLDPNAVCAVDTPTYFLLSEFVEAISSRLSTRPPFATNHGAWASYASDRDAASQLAIVVAKRTGTNYYLATMVSNRLAGADAPVDVTSPEFDVQVVPEDVDQLLEDVFMRFDEPRRRRLRIVMTALAYGKGSGLSDERWMAFSTVLGLEGASAHDLLDVRDSPLQSFIVDRVKDGTRLTTYFHRSVQQALKKRRTVLSDERAICNAMRLAWREQDHAGDPYIHSFLPSHVLDAGISDDYLSDVDFVVRCDPSAVAPLARQAMMLDHGSIGVVYLMALPYLGEDPAANAQALFIAATAHSRDQFAQDLSAVASWGEWQYVGGMSRPSRASIDHFSAHSAGISALSTVRSERGSDLVVSAAADGSVRMWDPFIAGLPTRAAIPAGGPAVLSLICWRDGEDLWVGFGDAAGSLRIWNPTENESPDDEVIAQFESPLVSLTRIEVAGFGFCFVCATEGGAIVVRQDVPPYKEVAQFRGHEGAALRFDTVTWAGVAGAMVVSAGADHSVQIWNPVDGSVVAKYEEHNDWVGSLAVHRRGDSDEILVSSGGDSVIIARNLSQSKAATALRNLSHRGRVRDVEEVEYPAGRPAIVSSADDATARIWAIENDAWVLLEEFDGATAAITATVQAIGKTGAIFVSGCQDGLIHLWDPKLWDLPSDDSGQSDAHASQVRSSTVVESNHAEGRLLVTSSNDGTARVWKMEEGSFSALGVFAGHEDWVRDLTTLEWPGLGRNAVASASGDSSVQIWDVLDPETSLVIYHGHTAQVRSVRPCHWPGVAVPVLLTAAQDGSARVWNPYAQPSTDLEILWHEDVVRCAVQIDGARDPRILTVSDATLRIWTFGHDHKPQSEVVLTGTSELRDVVVFHDDRGELWVAAAGNDGLLYGKSLDQPSAQVIHGTGHRGWIWGLEAVSTPSGSYLVSVSGDGTLRTWRHLAGSFQETARLNLLSACLSVRRFDHELIITTSRGFHVLRIRQP